VDLSARLALTTGIGVTALLLFGRLWLQWRRGTLRLETELPFALVLLGLLALLTVILSSRLTALLGLPIGLFVLTGLAFRFAVRDGSRTTVQRGLAIAGMVAAAGWFVIGLVRLATGT
jgi:hypothetical protein